MFILERYALSSTFPSPSPGYVAISLACSCCSGSGTRSPFYETY